MLITYLLYNCKCWFTQHIRSILAETDIQIHSSQSLNYYSAFFKCYCLFLITIAIWGSKDTNNRLENNCFIWGAGKSSRFSGCRIQSSHKVFVIMSSAMLPMVISAVGVNSGGLGARLTSPHGAIALNSVRVPLSSLVLLPSARVAKNLGGISYGALCCTFIPYIVSYIMLTL